MLKYKVMTTAGFGFIFRNVESFTYSHEEAKMKVVSPKLRFTVNGVSSIVCEPDDEDSAQNMEIVPPKNPTGGASLNRVIDPDNLEFRDMSFDLDGSTNPFRYFNGRMMVNEPAIPLELAESTFAPLERFLPESAH